MKRTWKDAACEVAWNARHHNTPETGPIKFYGINVKYFLCGIYGCMNPDEDENGILYPTDFPAFRAAFMKWLEDNEVKK